MNGLVLNESAEIDTNNEYEALQVTLTNYTPLKKTSESADFGVFLQPR